MTAALALRVALKEAHEALREAKARRHRTRTAFLLAEGEVLSARADVLAAAAALHEAEPVARRLNVVAPSNKVAR